MVLSALVWLRRPSLDRRLARGDDPAQSAQLTRRAERLLSARSRREIAARVEQAIDDAELPPRLPSAAAPLGRDAIRAARAELLGLARDLRAREPVGAAGVVLARELLFDGASALYGPGGEAALVRVVEQASWGLLIAPRAAVVPITSRPWRDRIRGRSSSPASPSRPLP
jgi:hypothetical protein